VPALKGKRWTFQPSKTWYRSAESRARQHPGSVQGDGDHPSTGACTEVSGDLLERAPAGSTRRRGHRPRARPAASVTSFHVTPAGAQARPSRAPTTRRAPVSPASACSTPSSVLKGARRRCRALRAGQDPSWQQQIAPGPTPTSCSTVGCGERGNELVDVLETFPELRTRARPSLMERTFLGRQYLRTCRWWLASEHLRRRGHGRVLPATGLRVVWWPLASRWGRPCARSAAGSARMR